MICRTFSTLSGLHSRHKRRSRLCRGRCRIWRGLIGEKQILIRIWSNFLVPSLPDTSLCEAQGDGGGPAISCRLSGERQIGREDRRKIDMMLVEPPAANLACEIAMSRAAIVPWMLQSNSRASSVVIRRILRGLSAAKPGRTIMDAQSQSEHPI